MKLSAPLPVLKQRAKALARQDSIRLRAALDRIAQQEGYGAWSHLAARAEPGDAIAALFERLGPGDLVLIGARPGQGKTLLAFGLAIAAMTRGHPAALFSLEFTAADVARCFGALDRSADEFGDRLLVDVSEQICAAHVAARLAGTPAGTLVVIDYLQLLDQRRDTPGLAEQVRELKDFAARHQAIVVCLAQIRRGFEAASKPYPDWNDVRLPNPLDLSLFDKACFLHQGRMQLVASEPGPSQAAAL